MDNYMISSSDIIKSPISSGYIDDCLKIREKLLGKTLYQLWKFFYPIFAFEKPERHYGYYAQGIEEQAQNRPSISVKDWPSQKHYEISKRIEKRIASKCWGTELEFYPIDSFYIIGEFEVGDGSENELFMQIEEDFNFLFNESFEQQFSIETTFLDVVDYVVDHV